MEGTQFPCSSNRSWWAVCVLAWSVKTAVQRVCSPVHFQATCPTQKKLTPLLNYKENGDGHKSHFGLYYPCHFGRARQEEYMREAPAALLSRSGWKTRATLEPVVHCLGVERIWFPCQLILKGWSSSWEKSALLKRVSLL
jgi:hypothetical protein